MSLSSLLALWLLVVLDWLILNLLLICSLGCLSCSLLLHLFLVLLVGELLLILSFLLLDEGSLQAFWAAGWLPGATSGCLGGLAGLNF